MTQQDNPFAFGSSSIEDVPEGQYTKEVSSGEVDLSDLELPGPPSGPAGGRAKRRSRQDADSVDEIDLGDLELPPRAIDEKGMGPDSRLPSEATVTIDPQGRLRIYPVAPPPADSS